MIWPALLYVLTGERGRGVFLDKAAEEVLSPQFRNFSSPIE
jgi:hypothetical protein